jgi:1-acyl-sn-glycerol-3-phosphate acyltransferase
LYGSPVLRALVASLLLSGNLLLWGTPVILLGVVKVFTRREPRRRVTLAIAWLAERWVGGTIRILDWTLTTEWIVDGVDGLDHNGHYLLVSNHVSWVDVLALMRAFHRRAAFIRFFIKQELIWFPIGGQACWALDFPFMKRYTPEFLEKHPEKRGTDLETTRRACRRYRRVPVTIANFLEGTRFTPAKHAQQDSPYRHLLRPHSGGLSFALASLGDQLDGVFDVTLAYPGGPVSMARLLTNRVPRVIVRARRLAIPEEFMSDEVTRPGAVRERFKAWLRELWEEKDALLDRLEGSAPPAKR